MNYKITNLYYYHSESFGTNNGTANLTYNCKHKKWKRKLSLFVCKPARFKCIKGSRERERAIERERDRETERQRERDRERHSLPKKRKKKGFGNLSQSITLYCTRRLARRAAGWGEVGSDWFIMMVPPLPLPPCESPGRKPKLQGSSVQSRNDLVPVGFNQLEPVRTRACSPRQLQSTVHRISINRAPQSPPTPQTPAVCLLLSEP